MMTIGQAPGLSRCRRPFWKHVQFCLVQVQAGQAGHRIGVHKAGACPALTSAQEGFAEEEEKLQARWWFHKVSCFFFNRF